MMDALPRQAEGAGTAERCAAVRRILSRNSSPGPILRASSFLPQLRAPAQSNAIRVNRALLLIVAGLFKKVVISNLLATRLVEQVFASPQILRPRRCLLAIYGYAAQIYCDFSGYTDIAIGCAMLLGYRFPRNFNAPYTATDPQDFWRRWHISLSTGCATISTFRWAARAEPRRAPA